MTNGEVSGQVGLAGRVPAELRLFAEPSAGVGPARPPQVDAPERRLGEGVQQAVAGDRGPSGPKSISEVVGVRPTK